MLYVAADKLAGHSLPGFFEIFVVDRFCLESRSEIQDEESSTFDPQTKDSHNQQVQGARQDPTVAKQYGVKGVIRGYLL